jgi:hypothetical protein
MNNIQALKKFLGDLLQTTINSFLDQVAPLTPEIRRGSNQPLQKPQSFIPRRLD